MATGQRNLSNEPSVSQNYMQPWIGSDTSPFRSQVGVQSPDVSKETQEAQSASVTTALFEGSTQTPTSKENEPRITVPKPGPIDPLTGTSDENLDISSAGMMQAGPNHILGALIAIHKALRTLVTEQRAQIPQSRCILTFKGPLTLTNANTTDCTFQIAGKNVPALKLFVQNNTQATIYFDMDRPATTGSIELAAGAAFISAVRCSNLSLLNSVAGPTNINSGTAGIVIQAWSNPEFTAMWGEI